VLSQLYTEEFWNNFDKFVFRSREFGVIVLYAFPAANLSDLANTKRVSMRGLYINVDPPPRIPAPPSKFATWLRGLF
jgi:hypothetical protein